MILQGMSFIAAVLILNMDEADAFITFANLLNWPQLAAFFCMSEAKVRLKDCCLIGKYLDNSVPLLTCSPTFKLQICWNY